MPKLSVIVPVYNTEKYLNNCIHSILGQTFKDFELILINDGSTDSSAFLCDELAKKDARIRVIHKKNEGQGIARNCGISIATGEYMAFVDSDDYIENTMYEALIAAGDSYDVVLCRIKRVLANKSIEIADIKSGEYNSSRDITAALIYPLIGVLSAKENPILASACRGIYKTKIIKANNLCFESEKQYLSEDLLFNINFLSHCNSAKCVDKALYCYFDNQNSFSTSYSEDRFYKIKRLYTRAAELCSGLGYRRADYECRLATTIAGHISVCVKQIIANANVLGHNRVNTLIKEIAQDEITKTVLRICDYHKLQLPLRVFCFLLEYKQYLILKILIKIFLLLNL